MMNAHKNVSAPPLRSHVDRTRSSGGERKVSKNSSFPREGERRKRQSSTVKSSPLSTCNVEGTPMCKSNSTFTDSKKREDQKDMRMSYKINGVRSYGDEVEESEWEKLPQPVTKSRAKSEGKRAGMKWTIYIDTAGGHVTKRLKIVRGIETFEEDDYPSSPIATEMITAPAENRADQSSSRCETYCAPRSIKSAPSLAPFPSDDDIPATPVSQVNQLSCSLMGYEYETKIGKCGDGSREAALPDVPNLREENDSSFLPSTLLLRTPIQTMKGQGFQGDLVSPLETPSLGTTMDDESIENSAHLSLDKIDGDQWGYDQNISSSESEESVSSNESETEMFENDDTYVKEYLIAKMEQEQFEEIYDEESIDPLDDFKPRVADPSKVSRQNFVKNNAATNAPCADVRTLDLLPSVKKNNFMSKEQTDLNRNLSSLPEHEVVPDSTVGPWTLERCEEPSSKQLARRKSHKTRKRSTSKTLDGVDITAPTGKTPSTVPPPNCYNTNKAFIKQQVPLRASRNDSSSRFSNGDLRRKDLSSPGVKLPLVPEYKQNETNEVLPRSKPNPVIQKTEALLKSLGSVSSSESSSSAYSLGLRRHMLQTNPSLSSSSSPGMLLNNPHRFPDNEFDAERSATFMQFNVSATDGVQVVDNEKVQNSHIQMQPDHHVPDDNSTEEEDETQAVIPRFSALQTNESTSSDPPRKPIRASELADQNAVRSTKRGVRGIIRTISNLQNRNEDAEKKSRRDDNERRSRFFGFGNSSFGNLPTPAELLEDDSFAS